MISFVSLQWKKKEEQLCLVVVAREGRSLLGRDWLSKRKLDWGITFSTQVQETLCPKEVRGSVCPGHHIR